MGGARGRQNPPAPPLKTPYLPLQRYSSITAKYSTAAHVDANTNTFS